MGRHRGKTGTQYNVPQEVADEIRRLARHGLTDFAICKRLGLTRTEVWRAIRDSMRNRIREDQQDDAGRELRAQRVLLYSERVETGRLWTPTIQEASR